MREEESYKEFREIYESRPEPVFEEKAWKDMEKRLDNSWNAPVAGIIWWKALVGSCFLVLLGMNGWMYMNWKSVSEDIKTLNEEFERMSTERSLAPKDTFIKTVVFKDTIVLFQKNTQYASSKKEDKTSQQGPLNSDLKLTPNLSPAIHSPEKGAFRPKQAPLLLTQTTDSSFNRYLSDNEGVSHINSRSDQPSIDELPQILTKGKAKKSLKEWIGSKKTHIGVFAGMTRPTTKGLYAHSGHSIGIEGKLNLSTGVQLWTEAAYVNLHFETDRIDEDLGIPKITLPAEGLVFMKSHIPQTSFQFALGIQYEGNANGKWKPYWGIGVAGRYLLPYEIDYEFYNEAIDAEWVFQKDILEKGLMSNFLMAKSGIGFEFAPQYQLTFRVNYRKTWTQSNLNNADLISFQLGTFYHF